MCTWSQPLPCIAVPLCGSLRPVQHLPGSPSPSRWQRATPGTRSSFLPFLWMVPAAHGGTADPCRSWSLWPDGHASAHRAVFGQRTVIIGTWSQKARSTVCSGLRTTHKNNSCLSALFGKHGQDWGRNCIDNLVWQAVFSQLGICSGPISF